MMTRISQGVIVIAALSVGLVAISGFVTHVFAANGNEQHGINIADENVHTNVPGGLSGTIDQKFHSGLCHAGISTNAFTCP
jgi:hypothetical protein